MPGFDPSWLFRGPELRDFFSKTFDVDTPPGPRPVAGSSAGQASVVGNFPGRINLAMGATGVATSSASLGITIRFKQSATGTATTTGTTLTVPVSALAVGDLVVVAWAANYGPSSVTATGVTFSAPSSSANFYYGKVTSAGGTGVTVNWSAGTPMNVHVMVFANADVALDDSWAWTGNNVTNTPTIGSGSYNFGNDKAPVAAGNLVVAVAQWNTAATLSSTGGGFTSTSADIGATTTFRSVAAWRVYAATTQSPAATWTVSATTTWLTGAIVIVPTQGAVPAAPRNVRIYHQNGGAQLNWDIVPGATSGYKVYESGTLVATINAGLSTGASVITVANLSGLSPGASKSYTVRAVNSFGQSADSTALAFIAAACPAWSTRNKYPATNPPTVASTTQSLTQVGVAGQAYVLSVVIHDGTTSITGVTGGGGTAWQRVGRQVNPVGSMAVELWYSLGVAAGSDTITATASSSVFFNIDLAAVANVDGAERFNTQSGDALVIGSKFTLPISDVSTDGAFYVAVVGEADPQFSPQVTAQSLPFSDNVMADGAGYTSKTWFVAGLGAGADSRMGSGLAITSAPNANWAAVTMVLTRAKVQLASTPAGAGGGSGSLSVAASSVTLAATPASVATVQGAIPVTRQVTASVASVGASSATVKMARGMTSSVTGLGVVTSAVAVTRTFASAPAGQAATLVSLAVRRALAAAAAGQATDSAAMVVCWSLSAAPSAHASVLASPAVTHPLSATSAAVSSTVAAVAIGRAIAASVHGAGVSSSAIVIRLALVGSSAAGGVAGADATVIPAGLAAGVGGHAGATGSPGVTYSVTASVAGQGAVVAQAALRRGLLAAVAGMGASVGDVALRRVLVGTVFGDASCVVSTSVLRAMSANSSAIATAAGGVRVRYALSSAPSGAATTGAVLIKGPLLAGRGDGRAGSDGAARVTHTLVAAMTGHGAVSSTMSRELGLAGVTHGASVTLPSFGVIHPVAGTTSGSGSVAATSTLRRGLQGAAGGQAGQSAAMVFRVRLAAHAEGFATTSGAALRGRGFVVTTTGVGQVSATLWDALPVLDGHPVRLVLRSLAPVQALGVSRRRLALEARGEGESLRVLDRDMSLRAL